MCPTAQHKPIGRSTEGRHWEMTRRNRVWGWQNGPNRGYMWPNTGRGTPHMSSLMLRKPARCPLSSFTRTLHLCYYDEPSFHLHSIHRVWGGERGEQPSSSVGRWGSGEVQGAGTLHGAGTKKIPEGCNVNLSSCSLHGGFPFQPEFRGRLPTGRYNYNVL